MFSFLLRQITGSFGIFFRTIRAFFTRQVTRIGAYGRRITNVSRYATKVASTSFQGAATAVKKPTKREDYIETQRLFVSKSFLILLAVGLVVAALLIYFVVWPFLLSHFFTAHFWQEDGDLDSWSGRVVVYYDEAKENPMYSGTLEDGLLQGQGREYDEDGLLIYEGNFVDGVRSGTGSCYEGGVLVYEGEFANGLYEGMGSLYEDGALAYRGNFAAGLQEGDGTAYYPSGERAYTGSFAQGLYEGEGTAYRENGDVLYRGSFAQGLYDGSGTLYLEDGDQIRGEFAAGQPDGSIQWYQDGKLWYEGGLTELAVDGYGTLYAESGDVIYAGEFCRGTLDGAWLLGLTAGELREAFGEAELTETDRGDSFLIVNQELGLTALCSYQQGESESQVYRLWLAPEEDSPHRELIPWESLSEADLWAAQDQEETPQVTRAQGAAYQADGTVGGDWFQSQYRYEDCAMVLLSQEEDGAPEEISWSRDMTLPAGTVVDESVSQAQERLDSLLAALEAAGSGASGGSGSSAASGLGDVERLVGLMLTVDDGQELVDALTDYYMYREMTAALEGSQPMLEQNLASAQTQLQRGTGTQEAVDSAQAQLDELDRQLAQYQTGQEQARLTIQELCKLDPEDYDLQKVLITFDPVELDASALVTAAVEYAQAAAAGQYEVDTAALERQVKSAVLDLSMAYESIRSARESVTQAASEVETQTQAYATGSGTKEALYSAQCAQNEAAADLCQAIGTFTKQANQLNTLSGGWIAETYDWMPDTFGTLFQSEILRGQEAAQAAQEEREQQEQEAAQAIQEEQAQQEEQQQQEEQTAQTEPAA